MAYKGIAQERGFNGQDRRRRFFLRIDTRHGFQYYLSSGLIDPGGSNEERYLCWTKYPQNARGFATIRRARRMAEMLREGFGVEAVVVTGACFTEGKA